MLTELLTRQSEGQEIFCHAELTEDVKFIRWTSFDPRDMKPQYYTKPKGTKVLITTISNKGKIGIRDTDIDTLKHGYTALVNLNQVSNLQFIEVNSK